MPTVNIVFSGTDYQDFLVSSPITGVCRITNNGTFAVYVRDTVTGSEEVTVVSGGPTPGTIASKIKPGWTCDVAVVQNRKYSINVCGAVSLDYTLIPG